MKPVTIHDVASKAGVGIGTVSSVFNCSRPVNEATRQKVLAAIKELGYTPNPIARRLSLGKTDTIGIIIPFFTIASQIERLRGVMSIIVGSDYEISLHSVETVAQRNEVLQKVAHRGSVDGLLIFSLNPTEKDLKRIKQSNVPTVLVESIQPKLSNIYLDDTAAAREAVEHLIGLGHRKIAYLSTHLDNSSGTLLSKNRYLGYCQALEAAGIPVNPEYNRQSRWFGIEDGRRLALEVLQLPDPPTAIFAFMDEMALGVLEAAREMGLRVPDDLSVVGYDDIRLSHSAQLTTVDQQLYETGVRGISLLLDLIENPDVPSASIQMSTHLVVRQTTAPLT